MPLTGHLDRLLRRSARVALSAGLCLSVLLACADQPEIRVRLTSSVPQLSLTTNDTLVIERTIHNDGVDTVWLGISGGSPAFTAMRDDGSPSCHLGSTTTVLGLLPIPGRSSVTNRRSYPVRYLHNCGPGAHRVRVEAAIGSSMYGDDGVVLYDDERILRIR